MQQDHQKNPFILHLKSLTIVKIVSKVVGTRKVLSPPQTFFGNFKNFSTMVSS